MTTNVPPAVQRLLGNMIDDWHRRDMKREQEAAEADPLGHKNSTVFRAGESGYRYYSVKSRGRTTRYCWSTHRNVAGFFLGWVEIETKQRLRRVRFVSRRVKARVRDLALARCRAHRARLAKAKGEPR